MTLSRLVNGKFRIDKELFCSYIVGMGKKRGPKPKSPSETKEGTIQLRVNEAEKAQFVRAAALDNRPLSSWIRDRLLRISEKELGN